MFTSTTESASAEMQTLLAVFLTCAAASLLFTAVTHAAVERVRKRPSSPGVTPKISVLKPLKGVDDDLYQNLLSLAQQDYPDFELIFGAEDADDPALSVARRVQRECSERSIRVVSGAPSLGLNPKVNNLRLLAKHASHDLLLISDASVRARPDYLAAMAAELSDSSVGLVSSVLVGSGERTLGARLDNSLMNSFVVRGVCCADELVAHPCVVGKSMLFRRSDLERLGGFALVENVLAEDYVLGRSFERAGYRVVLSPHLLESVSARRTVRDFWARHLRWSQMRRRLSPMIYFGEPLQSPIPWLLGSFGFLCVDPVSAEKLEVSLAIAAGVAFRMASEARLSRTLRGQRLTWVDYPTIVLRDLLFIGIWLTGSIKRTVRWRDGPVFRIGPSSQLFPVEAEEPRSHALEGV